jgi:glutathione S-transferase
MREAGIENGRKVLLLAMKTKGSSPFIAGDLSLPDLYLAPIVFYASLTPDKDAVFNVDGFRDWWTRPKIPRVSRTRRRIRVDRA